jgi:AraC family transcriptional regulator
MLQDDRRVTVFRLGPPWRPEIPLRVRSVGRNDVVRGWSEPPFQKWFMELTWCVSGTGEARVGDAFVPLAAGEVLVYRPGDIHLLRATSERWLCYWITMDHPEAARWFEVLGLGTHTRSARACPERSFLAAMDHLRQGTVAGEEAAAAEAHAILLAASASRPDARAPSSMSAQARAMMDANHADPSYDVNAIAGRLGVHRSTLFRHFNDVYNVTPSAYLLHIRLDHGIRLLQNTALPIHAIARAVGFADANYFARAIRKATGRTPRSFRSPSASPATREHA